MKVAYFECFAGASGDMILGTLLDAGLPLERLEADISCLKLSCYDSLPHSWQRRTFRLTQMWAVILTHFRQKWK